VSEQIVVAGLGEFGSILARAMTEAGHEVLGIDRRQDPVRELASSIGKTVQGDATSLGLWNDLPVKGATIAVVAFSSNVEANVLTAVLLRKIGFRRIIARSSSDIHSELLRAIGVEVVVEPSRQSALQLAHVLNAPLSDYLDVTHDYGVARIDAVDQLAGQKANDVYNRKKVAILLIRRGDHVIIEPKDEEPLKVGDTLVCAGKDGDLRALAFENTKTNGH
jgi:trk system potassium uptake protein TrkA